MRHFTHAFKISVVALVLSTTDAASAADTIFHDGFELCRVPGVIEWDGGGDGASWSDPLNWEGDTLPVDGDAVAIRAPDSVTVEYAGLTTSLSCLSSTANFVVSTGDLVLDGPATMTANMTIQGGTVTANARSSVSGDFDLSKGNLDGPGVVTINGLFTWTGGNQSDVGETIANGGLLVSGAQGKNLSERTLTLNAASTWGGTGATTLRWSTTINVNAPLEIVTGADMNHIQGGNPLMIITGSVTKSAGVGLTSIGAELVNNGSISVDSGQLSFVPGNLTTARNSSGEFTVAAGSTLTIRGNQTFDASSVFSGEGGFEGNGGTAIVQGSYNLTGSLGVSAGTLQFDFSPTIAGDVILHGNGVLQLPAGANIGGNVNIDSGTLFAEGSVDIAGTLQQEPQGKVEGTGTITVDGLFTWNGGNQHDLGETIANGGMLMTGANSKDLTERTLTLNAASSWTDAGALTLRWGSTINVNAPFDIATDADMSYLQGGVPQMNITSSVIKSAGAAITGIGAAIENSGSIAVDSGQLNFSYSYSQTPSGTLEVKIGGDADFDTFPVANAAALDGNLNIILTGGYEPTLDKTFEIMTAPSVTGQFSVVNGTAIVAGRKFDVLYTANNVTLKVVSD